MKFSRAARQDLAHILDRIATDSGFTRSAKIAEKFDQSFALIDSFAGLGTVHPDLHFKGNVVRTFVISSWIVYYTTLDRTCWALRVLHHSQDAASQNLISHSDLEE